MTLLIVPVIVVVMMLAWPQSGRRRQILGSPSDRDHHAAVYRRSAWHMKIAWQVVIEDYLHHEKLKLAAIMANNFFCVAVALASIYAIFKLSSGV